MTTSDLAYDNLLDASAILVERVKKAEQRIVELETLIQSFVLDEIDYMTRNNLGDPEKQYNIRWARKLGIKDTLP